MSNKLDKYKFIKELEYFESLPCNMEQEFNAVSLERESFENIIHRLISIEKWDIIFKYFNIYKYKLTENQTREGCLKFLKETKKSHYTEEYNMLQYIIKQDDELVLEALKKNLFNLSYVRIPLKKETLVEIDLLYTKRIEEKTELKFHYMILMEEAIE